MVGDGGSGWDCGCGDGDCGDRSGVVMMEVVMVVVVVILLQRLVKQLLWWRIGMMEVMVVIVYRGYDGHGVGFREY